MDDLPARDGSLSVLQELIMVLLPVPIALLSTLASCVLCRLILIGRLKSPYERLLFVISVLDIISSLAFLLQPFLLPIDTSPRFYALGTQSTCQVTGMLFQFGATGTALYSLSLSIFFLCKIRFAMPSSEFAAKVEPILHMISLGVPLSTSVASYAMDALHESALSSGCYIDCADELVAAGECNAHVTAYLFVGLPLFVSLAGLFVNNLWIYQRVRHIIRKSYKGAMNQGQQSERIQQVAVQAFLYVAAYLGTYSWSVALRVLESQGFTGNDEVRLFPILLLQALFIPATGIFNLMIFLRRKYLHIRKSNPLGSRRSAWQTALLELYKNSNGVFHSSLSKTRSKQSDGMDRRVAVSASSSGTDQVRNDDLDFKSMQNYKPLGSRRKAWQTSLLVMYHKSSDAFHSSPSAATRFKQPNKTDRHVTVSTRNVLTGEGSSDNHDFGSMHNHNPLGRRRLRAWQAALLEVYHNSSGAFHSPPSADEAQSKQFDGTDSRVAVSADNAPTEQGSSDDLDLGSMHTNDQNGDPGPTPLPAVPATTQQQGSQNHLISKRRATI
jgi:hypothetical protein